VIAEVDCLLKLTKKEWTRSRTVEGLVYIVSEKEIEVNLG
jgi:hypothetical protein